MAIQTQQAQDWWMTKARTAAGYRDALMSNSQRLRNNIAMGKLYFFFYDPKHKATLPIYDRFPLVFPIERYSDGFLGLNLHYLDVSERKALLDELMKHANSSVITPKTKLNLTYQTLNNSARMFGLSRPCVKRYLRGHLRSRFVEITADEWDKVIELPVASFVRKR